MKLCVECKFGPSSYIDRVYGMGNPKCRHEKAPRNPVDGNYDGSCSLMRSRNCTIEQCGPDGDWFEAAPPMVVPEYKPYSVADIQKPKQPKKKFWRIFG